MTTYANFLVIPGAEPDHDNGIFGNIQDAINKAAPNTIIKLGPGVHKSSHKNSLQMKSSLHFTGTLGAEISSRFDGNYSDVVFDNITFRNYDNNPIVFQKAKNIEFRNCTFIVDVSERKYRKSDVQFGIQLISTSAIFQNPIINVNIRNVHAFAMMYITRGSEGIINSPIITVSYCNSYNIDIFGFDGDGKCLPTLSVSSASIEIKYVKQHTKDKRHTIALRLLRNRGDVIPTLGNTRVVIKDGSGSFSISKGDSISYINGLTVIVSCPDEWIMGDFTKLLLKSFISNISDACEIEECGFIPRASSSSSDSSGSEDEGSRRSEQTGASETEDEHQRAVRYVGGNIITPFLAPFPK